MILAHYNNTPGDFYIRNWTYKVEGSIYKPDGLWISHEGKLDKPNQYDETEIYGWAEWARDNEYNRGQHRHEVTLAETANIRWITNGEELEAFHDEYCHLDDFNRRYHYPWSENRHWPINWAKVKEEYDGIFITPYLWSHRLQGPHWYYTWDCASGCIWNTNAILSVAPSKEITV